MVKINLKNIPSKRVYVLLNKEAIEYINNLIKKSGTSLKKNDRENFYRISIGKKCSLEFLLRICNVIEIPIEFIEKNIILLTSVKNTSIGIKNPKLPFNFKSKEGLIFISSIMGDGEINNQLQVRYNNQNKELVDKIKKCVNKIFGEVSYKIYLREDKTYQLHFPKIIGIIMTKIGLKPGYKSITNYGIPNFIFKTNKNLKCEFLKQFFNDEGNVRLKDRRIQIKQTTFCKVKKEECRKEVTKYCHKALLDIQKIFMDFNIKSKISLGNKRENKADWELSIYGIENLLSFQKNIGFDLSYKNKLLDKSIKSYKFPSAPRNGRLNFALEKCRNIQKRKGFFTKYDLAKESKRSLKTAAYFLIDLNKKEKIRCIEKPRSKKGRPQARKYILI